jgi:serine/threonine protein kinase
MTWLDPERAMAIPSLPDREFPESEWLHAVLDKALAFDPAMRFQSAHEMLAELEEYALATQLMASQLRFAAFLSLHFEAAFAELRLLRERAADLALESWHADPSDAGESGSRPLPQASARVEPARPQVIPPPAAVLPSYAALSGSDDLDTGTGAFRAKGVRPLYIGLVVVITALLAYWLATH